MMGQTKVDETLLADAVYLPGQIANLAKGASVAAQTDEILQRIDEMLLHEGTEKSEIILANIWLSDLASFEEMNGVWDAWMPESVTPRRATLEDKNLPPMCDIRIDVAASRKRGEQILNNGSVPSCQRGDLQWEPTGSEAGIANSKAFSDKNP